MCFGRALYYCSVLAAFEVERSIMSALPVLTGMKKGIY